MKRLAITMFLLATACAMHAQQRAFVPEIYVSEAGDTLFYRALYPVGYDESKQYPLLLFLHGAGERGNDNVAQLKHCTKQMMASRDVEGMIVLLPQCPKGNSWSPRIEDNWRPYPYDAEPTLPGRLVKELLDKYIASGVVQTRHIYCTGISMGGMGTFDMACRYPSLFAAVTPICGGINLMRLAQFSGQTAWRMFHGDQDKAVPVQNSRDAYDVLKAGRYPVEYTEYPGLPHNCWDTACSEPDFFSWFLKY